MNAGLSSSASAIACSGGSRKVPVGGVVLHVAAGRLLAEPLAYVALAALRALGELRGRDRLAVGHRLVQAELVPDQHQRRRHAPPEVAYELAHELFQLRFVDSRGAHRMLLC